VSTRSRGRRWLGAALALPVLAGGLLFFWLVYTGHGLQRLVGWLESLDRPVIRLQGVQGRLAGPLHVDLLTLSTERVFVRVEGLELEHDLPSLLLGRVDLGRLEAGKVTVELARSEVPPAPGPPQFLPAWLSIGLRQVRVAALEVGLPNGGRLAYSDVVASGTITSSRIRLDPAAVDGGAWTARGRVSLAAREPLELEGDIDWTVRAQPELSGTLRARGDLDRLDGLVTLIGPSAARVELTLLDLRSQPRWQARIEVEDFDLSPWSGEPPVGPLSGFVTGRGSFERFAVAGHLEGTGLPRAGVDLEGQIERDAADLRLDAARISTPDGRAVVTADGRLRLGDAPDLQLQAGWQGLAWPLDGAPSVTSRSGSLSLRGWQAFDYEVAAAVRLPEVPETRVSAAGRADSAGLTATRARLEGPLVEAEGTGYVGFQRELPWQLDATVRRLDLGRLREGLDSRLAFAAAGSGLGFGEESAWAVHLGPVSGAFRGYPVSGSGFVLHEQGGGYRFRQLDVEVGPAQLAVAGRLGGAATDLDVNLDVPDLSGLFPGAAGTLEARANLSRMDDATTGLPALRLDAAVRGRDLQWGDQRAAVLSADADVDLDNRAPSWVRLRAAGLTVGGQAIGSLRVSLDGLAQDHDFALRVGAGERAVDLVGEGSYEQGRYQLTADRFRSDAPRLQAYRLETPMEMAISLEDARLGETCFVYAPSRVCIAGEWQAGTGWSAHLDVTDMPLEALRLDLPRQPGYRGRLDLNLQVQQEGDAPWTAAANGALQEAFLLYRTPSGRAEELDLGITRLGVRSTLDRHEMTLSTEDSDALQMQARVSLGRLAGVALRDSPLEGRLTLETKRLGLLPLLVPEVDKAQGDVSADLTVAGTPSRPVAGGTVRFDVDALDLYATNLRLREAVARFTLLETGLRLESEGKAGDGTYQTAGELGWRDGDLQGTIRLQGERLLVADVPEARVEASPDLTFHIDGHEITMEGEVRIPSARIEPKQIVGAVNASPDARVVVPDAPEEETSPWRVKADVRLSLGKDVRLDAFGLKGRLEGSMLTRLRAEEVTTASGELEIQDGKYRAYSKELDVERGRLLFAGGPVTDPGVDLRASKSVPGYKVGVAVRGRLRRPEISLYSDPAMPQSQIASLLLVGRRLDNLDLNDRQSLGGSSGDMAAQGGAVLAGQLGRYVGVDEISYETDAETAEAEIVLGKFLSPRLYVSYGISLSDAINTFKARYTIGDRWVISGEAGQEASADVEYTIDR
jgi:translocation and assembly module TamB